MIRQVMSRLSHIDELLKMIKEAGRSFVDAQPKGAARNKARLVAWC